MVAMVVLTTLDTTRCRSRPTCSTRRWDRSTPSTSHPDPNPHSLALTLLTLPSDPDPNPDHLTLTLTLTLLTLTLPSNTLYNQVGLINVLTRPFFEEWTAFLGAASLALTLTLTLAFLGGASV